jgi:hypothetical protein
LELRISGIIYKSGTKKSPAESLAGLFFCHLSSGFRHLSSDFCLTLPINHSSQGSKPASVLADISKIGMPG